MLTFGKLSTNLKTQINKHIFAHGCFFPTCLKEDMYGSRVEPKLLKRTRA